MSWFGVGCRWLIASSLIHRAAEQRRPAEQQRQLVTVVSADSAGAGDCAHTGMGSHTSHHIHFTSVKDDWGEGHVNVIVRTGDV